VPPTLGAVKRVLILGSTGSIGTQALEVIGAADGLQVAGLSADSSWERVLAQARDHGVPTVALADADSAEQASAAWGGQVLAGEDGVRELIIESKPDLVLNAVVGAAGLGPTIVALTEGIDLALANKESLVIGGELVMALAEATDARILPVDSEHSALFQLIGAEPPGTVDRLVLTASGGPFRGRTDLSEVTAEEALAHPTWEMGGRITIDSATLMNKGFEMIEAHHLFGVPYERIDVVVHPQSIVHSLVHLNDGASLAHLGYPDMKVPISYALQYPERADVDVPTLDLASVGSLDFEQPDTGTFACLRLAREAGEVGGTAPCVLNAADEVAVEAFLARRISFNGIPDVIERTLEALPAAPIRHFEDLFDVDETAREHARGLVEGLAVA
jgi:1-deoxy-D-xylulose-5-phosphate reductoisomerase